MVRETRYLWVGNLPDKISEEDLTQHFQRYGKIQSVKFVDEDGGLHAAVVAFMDIKSASKAHGAENNISGKVLETQYSEASGRGAKLSRPPPGEARPGGPAGAPPPAGRYDAGGPPKQGYEGYTQYSGGGGGGGGSGGYFREDSGGGGPPSGPPDYYSSGQERGRPRHRYPPQEAPYYKQQSYDGYGYDKYGSSGPPSAGGWSGRPGQSPGGGKPAAASAAAGGKSGAKPYHSHSRSGSRSSSSSSSGSRSTGTSHSRRSSSKTSRERKRGSVVVQPHKKYPDEGGKSSGSGSRLGLLLKGFPPRSSDTSIRDGLFHEYKKCGKVMSVSISGEKDERYAIVTFKKVEDAQKGLEQARARVFFGRKVIAEPHDGVDDSLADYRPPEAELDEYHHKATRTLFVGNLNMETQKEVLKDIFRRYGIILDIDIKNQQPNQVFAFVQYDNIKSVVAALHEMDGETVGTSKVKLGFGRSMPTNVLWVDNVTEQVQENYLKRQFCRVAPVNYVLIDRETGRALVFYDSNELANASLSAMRGRAIASNKIQIDFASVACMNALMDNMEATGQLRPDDRPDQKGFRQYPQPDGTYADTAGTYERSGKQYYYDKSYRGRGGFRGAYRGGGRGGYYTPGSAPYEEGYKEKRYEGYEEETAPPGGKTGGKYEEYDTRPPYKSSEGGDVSPYVRVEREPVYKDEHKSDRRKDAAERSQSGDRESTRSYPSDSKRGEKYAMDKKYMDDKYTKEEVVTRKKEKRSMAYSPDSDYGRKNATRSSSSESITPPRARKSSRDKRNFSPTSPSPRHSSPELFTPTKKKSASGKVDPLHSTSLMSEIQRTRPRKHSLKRDSETGDLSELDRALLKQDLFESPPKKRQAIEEQIERARREAEAQIEHRKRLELEPPARGRSHHDYDHHRVAPVLDHKDHLVVPPPPEIESKFSTPSPSTKSTKSESDKTTPDSVERSQASHSSGEMDMLQKEKLRLINELQDMDDTVGSVSDGEIREGDNSGTGDERSGKSKKPRLEEVFDLEWSPTESSMKKWREQARKLEREKQMLDGQENKEPGRDNHTHQSKNAHTEPPPKPPEQPPAGSRPTEGEDPAAADAFKPAIDQKKSLRKQMEAQRKEHDQDTTKLSIPESSSGPMDTDELDTSTEKAKSTSEFKKKKGSSSSTDKKVKGARSYRMTCVDDMSFGAGSSGDEGQEARESSSSRGNRRTSDAGGKTPGGKTPSSEGSRSRRLSEAGGKTPSGGGGGKTPRGSVDEHSRRGSKDSRESSAGKKESRDKSTDKSAKEDRNRKSVRDLKIEPTIIPDTTIDIINKIDGTKRVPTDPRTRKPRNLSPVSLPLPKFYAKFIKKMGASPKVTSKGTRGSPKGQSEANLFSPDGATDRLSRRDSYEKSRMEADDSLERSQNKKPDNNVTAVIKAEDILADLKRDILATVKDEVSDGAEKTADKMEAKMDTEVKSELDKTDTHIKDSSSVKTESDKVKTEVCESKLDSTEESMDTSSDNKVNNSVDDLKCDSDNVPKISTTDDTDNTKNSATKQETNEDKHELDTTKGKPDTNNVDSHNKLTEETENKTLDKQADNAESKVDLDTSLQSDTTSTPPKDNKPNSDSDLSDLDNSGIMPSLDERIRALDEKMASSSASTPVSTEGRRTNTSSPQTEAGLSSTTGSPMVAAPGYRDRFKVRKRGDATATGSETSGSGAASTTPADKASGGEQSDYVKSLLARSSVFDQDTKRLQQIDEKYQPGEYNLNLDRPAGDAAGEFTTEEPEDEEFDARVKEYYGLSAPKAPSFPSAILRPAAGDSSDNSNSASDAPYGPTVPSLTFAPPGSLANQDTANKFGPQALSRYPFLASKKPSFDFSKSPPHTPISVDPGLRSPTGMLPRDPRRDPLSPPLVMPPSILKKSPVTTPVSPLTSPILKLNTPPGPSILKSPTPGVLKKAESNESLSDNHTDSLDKSPRVMDTKKDITLRDPRGGAILAPLSTGTGNTAKIEPPETSSETVSKNEFCSGDGVQYQSTPSPPVLELNQVITQAHGTIISPQPIASKRTASQAFTPLCEEDNTDTPPLLSENSIDSEGETHKGISASPKLTEPEAKKAKLTAADTKKDKNKTVVSSSSKNVSGKDSKKVVSTSSSSNSKSSTKITDKKSDVFGKKISETDKKSSVNGSTTTDKKNISNDRKSVEKLDSCSSDKTESKKKTEDKKSNVSAKSQTNGKISDKSATGKISTDKNNSAGSTDKKSGDKLVKSGDNKTNTSGENKKDKTDKKTEKKSEKNQNGGQCNDKKSPIPDKKQSPSDKRPFTFGDKRSGTQGGGGSSGDKKTGTSSSSTEGKKTSGSGSDSKGQKDAGSSRRAIEVKGKDNAKQSPDLSKRHHSSTSSNSSTKSSTNSKPPITIAEQKKDVGVKNYSSKPQPSKDCVKSDKKPQTSSGSSVVLNDSKTGKSSKQSFEESSSAYPVKNSSSFDSKTKEVKSDSPSNSDSKVKLETPPPKGSKSPEKLTKSDEKKPDRSNKTLNHSDKNNKEIKQEKNQENTKTDKVTNKSDAKCGIKREKSKERSNSETRIKDKTKSEDMKKSSDGKHNKSELKKQKSESNKKSPCERHDEDKANKHKSDKQDKNNKMGEKKKGSPPGPRKQRSDSSTGESRELKQLRESLGLGADEPLQFFSMYDMVKRRTHKEAPAPDSKPDITKDSRRRSKLSDSDENSSSGSDDDSAFSSENKENKKNLTKNKVSNRKYILSSSSDDFSSSDSDAPQSHKSNNKHIKSPPGSATKNKKSPNSAQKIGNKSGFGSTSSEHSSSSSSDGDSSDSQTTPSNQNKVSVANNNKNKKSVTPPTPTLNKTNNKQRSKHKTIESDSDDGSESESTSTTATSNKQKSGKQHSTSPTNNKKSVKPAKQADSNKTVNKVKSPPNSNNKTLTKQKPVSSSSSSASSDSSDDSDSESEPEKPPSPKVTKSKKRQTALEKLESIFSAGSDSSSGVDDHVTPPSTNKKSVVVNEKKTPPSSGNKKKGGFFSDSDDPIEVKSKASSNNKVKKPRAMMSSSSGSGSSSAGDSDSSSDSDVTTPATGKKNNSKSGAVNKQRRQSSDTGGSSSTPKTELSNKKKQLTKLDTFDSKSSKNTTKKISPKEVNKSSQSTAKSPTKLTNKTKESQNKSVSSKPDKKPADKKGKDSSVAAKESVNKTGSKSREGESSAVAKSVKSGKRKSNERRSVSDRSSDDHDHRHSFEKSDAEHSTSEVILEEEKGMEEKQKMMANIFFKHTDNIFDNLGTDSPQVVSGSEADQSSQCSDDETTSKPTIEPIAELKRSAGNSSVIPDDLKTNKLFDTSESESETDVKLQINQKFLNQDESSQDSDSELMPPPTPDFDHSLEDLTPSLSLSGEVIGDKSQELQATPAKVAKSPRRQSHGSASKQKSPEKAKAASLVVSEPVKNTVIETEKAVASLEKLWEDSTPAPTIVETGIVANVEIQSEALSGNEAEKPVNEDDDEMALAISSISAICGESSVVGQSAASGREEVLYIEEAVDSEAQQAVAALVFGDDAATSLPADQSQQPIQPAPTQAYRQIENEVPITVVQSSESVDEPVTVTDSVGSVAVSSVSPSSSGVLCIEEDSQSPDIIVVATPDTPNTAPPSTQPPTPATAPPTPATPASIAPSTPASNAPSTPASNAPSTPASIAPSTPASIAPSTPASNAPLTPASNPPSVDRPHQHKDVAVKGPEAIVAGAPEVYREGEQFGGMMDKRRVSREENTHHNQHRFEPIVIKPIVENNIVDHLLMSPKEKMAALFKQQQQQQILTTMDTNKDSVVKNNEDLFAAYNKSPPPPPRKEIKVLEPSKFMSDLLSDPLKVDMMLNDGKPKPVPKPKESKPKAAPPAREGLVSIPSFDRLSMPLANKSPQTISSPMVNSQTPYYHPERKVEIPCYITPSFNLVPPKAAENNTIHRQKVPPPCNLLKPLSKNEHTIESMVNPQYTPPAKPTMAGPYGVDHMAALATAGMSKPQLDVYGLQNSLPGMAPRPYGSEPHLTNMLGKPNGLEQDIQNIMKATNVEHTVPDLLLKLKNGETADLFNMDYRNGEHPIVRRNNLPPAPPPQLNDLKPLDINHPIHSVLQDSHVTSVAPPHHHRVPHVPVALVTQPNHMTMHSKSTASGLLSPNATAKAQHKNLPNNLLSPKAYSMDQSKNALSKPSPVGAYGRRDSGHSQYGGAGSLSNHMTPAGHEDDPLNSLNLKLAEMQNNCKQQLQQENTAAAAKAKEAQLNQQKANAGFKPQGSADSLDKVDFVSPGKGKGEIKTYESRFNKQNAAPTTNVDQDPFSMATAGGPSDDAESDTDKDKDDEEQKDNIVYEKEPEKVPIPIEDLNDFEDEEDLPDLIIDESSPVERSNNTVDDESEQADDKKSNAEQKENIPAVENAGSEISEVSDLEGGVLHIVENETHTDSQATLTLTSPNKTTAPLTPKSKRKAKAAKKGGVAGVKKGVEQEPLQAVPQQQENTVGKLHLQNVPAAVIKPQESAEPTQSELMRSPITRRKAKKDESVSPATGEGMTSPPAPVRITRGSGAADQGVQFSSRGRKIIPKERGDEIISLTRKNRRGMPQNVSTSPPEGELVPKINLKKGASNLEIVPVVPVGEPIQNGGKKKTWPLRNRGKDSEGPQTATKLEEEAEQADKVQEIPVTNPVTNPVTSVSETQPATTKECGPIKITIRRTTPRGRKGANQKTEEVGTPEMEYTNITDKPVEPEVQTAPAADEAGGKGAVRRSRRAKTGKKGGVDAAHTSPATRARKTDGSVSPRSKSSDSTSPIQKSYVKLEKLNMAAAGGQGEDRGDAFEFADDDEGQKPQVGDYKQVARAARKRKSDDPVPAAEAEEKPVSMPTPSKRSKNSVSKKVKAAAELKKEREKKDKPQAAPTVSEPVKVVPPPTEAATAAADATQSETKPPVVPPLVEKKDPAPEPRKPDMKDILQGNRGHLPLKLAMKWEAQEAARKEREAKEAVERAAAEQAENEAKMAEVEAAAKAEAQAEAAAKAEAEAKAAAEGTVLDHLEQVINDVAQGNFNNQSDESRILDKKRGRFVNVGGREEGFSPSGVPQDLSARGGTTGVVPMSPHLHSPGLPPQHSTPPTSRPPSLPRPPSVPGGAGGQRPPSGGQRPPSGGQRPPSRPGATAQTAGYEGQHAQGTGVRVIHSTTGATVSLPLGSKPVGKSEAMTASVPPMVTGQAMHTSPQQLSPHSLRGPSPRMPMPGFPHQFQPGPSGTQISPTGMQSSELRAALAAPKKLVQQEQLMQQQRLDRHQPVSQLSPHLPMDPKQTSPPMSGHRGMPPSFTLPSVSGGLATSGVPPPITSSKSGPGYSELPDHMRNGLPPPQAQMLLGYPPGAHMVPYLQRMPGLPAVDPRIMAQIHEQHMAQQMLGILPHHPQGAAMVPQVGGHPHDQSASVPGRPASRTTPPNPSPRGNQSLPPLHSPQVSGGPLTPQLPQPPIAALPGMPPMAHNGMLATLPPDGMVMQIQRYPVMWQGYLYLKNDMSMVEMHFVTGNKAIVSGALDGATEGGTGIVRIAQRMRLEPTQLDGVAKRMQKEDEYCILVAIPNGKDHLDFMHQAGKLHTGFISYLQQKQAAGIVNIPNPIQPGYVVHIFPPCEFSSRNISQRAPQLTRSLGDMSYLVVVITST